MSADWFVKRLRAAAGGLPIAGALAAALSLLLPGAPASRRRCVLDRLGARPRSLRRASSLAAATSPGSRLLFRPARSLIGAIPATLACRRRSTFPRSDNVASVEPEFPAPKRIKEADGGEAFGYDGSVVFPLRVKPRDPTKPATLKLNADFAVCEKVCLPAKAHLELTLPSAPDSPRRGRDRSRSRGRAARRCGEGFRRARGARRG